jgi:hypothetical protein
MCFGAPALLSDSFLPLTHFVDVAMAGELWAGLSRPAAAAAVPAGHGALGTCSILLGGGPQDASIIGCAAAEAYHVVAPCARAEGHAHSCCLQLAGPATASSQCRMALAHPSSPACGLTGHLPQSSCLVYSCVNQSGNAELGGLRSSTPAHMAIKADARLRVLFRRATCVASQSQAITQIKRKNNQRTRSLVGHVSL